MIRCDHVSQNDGNNTCCTFVMCKSSRANRSVKHKWGRRWTRCLFRLFFLRKKLALRCFVHGGNLMKFSLFLWCSQWRWDPVINRTVVYQMLFYPGVEVLHVPSGINWFLEKWIWVATHLPKFGMQKPFPIRGLLASHASDWTSFVWLPPWIGKSRCLVTPKLACQRLCETLRY